MRNLKIFLAEEPGKQNLDTMNIDESGGNPGEEGARARISKLSLTHI